MWAWHTLLLLTFCLHVDICSLDQIFSLCYLFFRHASYIIFDLHRDERCKIHTRRRSASRKKQDRCQLVTVSSSAQFNSWRFHLQHETFLSTAVTMTRSSSRLQHSKISRSEFCETNWHSIKLPAKQIARRSTRVRKIRSSDRSSPSRKTNDEVPPLRTMNVLHFHYAHRGSARMTVSLREWSWTCEKKKSPLWGRWLYLTSTWRIVSLREWSWVSDNGSQSLIFLFWKSVSSSWWRMKTLSTSQLCRSSCSSLRHLVNCRSSLCSSTSNWSLQLSSSCLSVETSLCWRGK